MRAKEWVQIKHAGVGHNKKGELMGVRWPWVQHNRQGEWMGVKWVGRKLETRMHGSEMAMGGAQQARRMNKSGMGWGTTGKDNLRGAWKKTLSDFQ